MWSTMKMRLLDGPEGVRLDNLREWSHAVPGGIPIADVKPGQPCAVAGVVRTIRIDPVSDTITAVLTDGGAEITVLWRISGPDEYCPPPGSAMFASGVATLDRDGTLKLEAPVRQRIPGPDEA